MNLLNNTTNQQSKFRKKIELKYDLQGTHNTNTQIKFKSEMLKLSLCNDSDEHILVKGTITVPNTTATTAATNNGNKKVIFKDCAPFTDCRSEINNRQVAMTKDIDVVISMYNLIEYSDYYLKTCGSL